MKKKKIVYVFESDEHGMLIGDSAIIAKNEYGAQCGAGNGLTGQAYAIPTLDMFGDKLSIGEIKFYISKFITYAENHPRRNFIVSKIGTSRYGLTEQESIDLFSAFDIPKNVELL